MRTSVRGWFWERYGGQYHRQQIAMLERQPLGRAGFDWWPRELGEQCKELGQRRPGLPLPLSGGNF